MPSSLGGGRGGVKNAPVIALTTDFGLEDPFVGIMKGVILGVCPGARLVDVTHGIPPQDVLSGCLALEAAAPFFPGGTVHLAVVDPGVGTLRPAVAVRTARALFVAPDNGLLSFLAEAEVEEVRRIENPDLWLHPVSRTFHGRDVFAPVAAHLAAGVPLERVGPPAGGIHRIRVPHALRAGDTVLGEILAFDRFGNALTSIRRGDVGFEPGALEVAGRRVPVLSAYAEASPGEPLALWGSTGRLEVSVREGSALRDLGLKRGDPVRVVP